MKSNGDGTQPLRLLFVNRSYHPDVEATGQLLTELCTDLAKVYDVTVLAGRPNFVTTQARTSLIGHESHEGVHIVRIRNLRFTKSSLLGRAVGLVSYLLLALWAGLTFRRPNLIIAETDPPLLGLLGALLKWWHRCPFIFYLQDLFPEVGLALGRLRPGLLTRLLWWATQAGLLGADRVIVLGEDMRRRVIERGIDPAKVDIVPNWADTTRILPVKRDNPLRREWQLDGQFVVMYSGNLGLSQGLEHVLEAAAALRREPVLFLLVGEGAAKTGLMARAKEADLTNVRFLPYQPKDRLSESLGAADLHLIPLRPGLSGYMVPSKLYGILASGTPYLAAVDADSEVAHVTRRHNTGLLIEPDSSTQMIAALRWCLGHREELRTMAERGRALAESEYDRSVAVAKFEQVIGAASGQSDAATVRRRHPLCVTIPT